MDKKVSPDLSKEEEKKEETVASTLTCFSNMSLASSSASTSKKLTSTLSKIVEIDEKAAEKGLQEAILWLTDNPAVFARFRRLSSYAVLNLPLPNPWRFREDKNFFDVKLLKAIDANMLPLKLFSVQSRDNYLMSSFGPGKNEDPSFFTERAQSESAFVKVKLVNFVDHDLRKDVPGNPLKSLENKPGKFDHLDLVESGFLASLTTGQMLKVRLQDGAFFLSLNGIRRISGTKGRPNPDERDIELELLQMKTISIPGSTGTEVPKFTRAAICEDYFLGEAPIVNRTSAQHLEISKMGVNVVEVHLSTLLEKGVILIKPKKLPGGLTPTEREKCQIVLYLAPWLSLEKYLPPLPEEEKVVEKDGQKDPKDDQDGQKDDPKDETGNEVEDPDNQFEVLLEEKKPQEDVYIEEHSEWDFVLDVKSYSF